MASRLKSIKAESDPLHEVLDRCPVEEKRVVGVPIIGIVNCRRKIAEDGTKFKTFELTEEALTHLGYVFSYYRARGKTHLKVTEVEDE